MSWTIDIWVDTFPADEAEAWARREELLAEVDARSADDPVETASPEMVELHRRLTTRFRCICDDEAGPWSDGPLINNFGQGHAILGISFSRVEDALPFVVETATSMGFHVFDGQDERVYRPVGFVAAAASAGPPAHQERPKWWQIWR